MVASFSFRIPTFTYWKRAIINPQRVLSLTAWVVLGKTYQNTKIAKGLIKPGHLTLIITSRNPSMQELFLRSLVAGIKDFTNSANIDFDIGRQTLG